jgi:hypothetical protein
LTLSRRGDSAAVSLTERQDAIAEEVVPLSRIDALLESGERLLDESRRLLLELNGIGTGTAPRSRQDAEPSRAAPTAPRAT